MSNDLRTLLREAAIEPAVGADVDAAWTRGRRLRARRRGLGALAIAAVVGLGSVGIAHVVAKGGSTSPAASVTTVANTCAPLDTRADLPAWTRSARPPNLPHRLSGDGNVVAIVFGDPLRAGHPADRSNKILWIVRQPRDGSPLRITATLPGTSRPPVHVLEPADSSPGEIYPSQVDVPVPGCWHLALTWNHHRSSVDLAYVAP